MAKKKGSKLIRLVPTRESPERGTNRHRLWSLLWVVYELDKAPVTAVRLAEVGQAAYPTMNGSAVSTELHQNEHALIV